MSLKDQLNAASRTKAETVNEQYKEDYKRGIFDANGCIEDIKNMLMGKVKHGEYEELLNGAKYVKILYKGSFIHRIQEGMGLVLEKKEYTERSMFSGGKTYTIIKYRIESQGRYDGFVKRIMEFSLEEDVSFKIVCRYETINKKYEFSPVVGCRIDSLVFESKIEFVIECSVEY